MPEIGKWIKKWKVKSDSSDREYTVSISENGTWGCSCPVWKFRRQECKHIELVKRGGGIDCEEIPEKPTFTFAMIRKPKYEKNNNRLLLPLVPFGGHEMEITICYYLLKYGYSMSEVREHRHIPNSWTREAIKEHVRVYGEAEYPENYYDR